MDAPPKHGEGGKEGGAGGGAPQLANSQSAAASLTAGSHKAKQTLEWRSRCLSPLKSSLILSTAEECLAGAHNHFMAQI